MQNHVVDVHSMCVIMVNVPAKATGSTYLTWYLQTEERQQVNPTALAWTHEIAGLQPCNEDSSLYVHKLWLQHVHLKGMYYHCSHTDRHFAHELLVKLCFMQYLAAAADAEDMYVLQEQGRHAR